MDRPLSKRAFYDELARTLRQDGWVRFQSAVDVTALFGKRIGELLLSLGFTESHLYTDRLTAEFTLGGHTFVTMSFPDAPRARMRVGNFLTSDERTALLSQEFNRPGVTDAWWTGRTVETAGKVREAVRAAEPRFLNQEGFTEEIAGSRRHAEHTRKLALIAATPTPTSDRAGIAPPKEWVMAAERLLSATPPKIRPAFAVELAADAWRTHVLLPVSV